LKEEEEGFETVGSEQHSFEFSTRFLIFTGAVRRG
jgi:hypothetical protein